MVKVNCEGCGSPYEVDLRRVPKGGMKMRCPGCDATFMVLSDGTTSSAPGSAPLTPSPLGDTYADLPAPRGGAFHGKEGFTDLPAAKHSSHRSPRAITQPDHAPAQPAATAPAPKLAPDFPDLDLPAPKPAAPRAPLAPDFSHVDLPAPKHPRESPRSAQPEPSPRSAQPEPGPDFGHTDLPARKHSKDTAAPRSFGRPARDEPPSRARTGGSPGLPKDSLAIDPEPFFQQMDPADPFAALDDPASSRQQTDTQQDGGVDLPRVKGGTTDLPAPVGAKRESAGASGLDPELPAPAATGRLPKDSLDISAFAAGGGFAAQSPFALDDATGDAHAPDPRSAAAPPTAAGLKLPTRHTGVDTPAARAPSLDLDPPAPSLPAESPADPFADLDLMPPVADTNMELDLDLQVSPSARGASTAQAPREVPAATLDLAGEDLDMLELESEPPQNPAAPPAVPPPAPRPAASPAGDPFARLTLAGESEQPPPDPARGHEPLEFDTQHGGALDLGFSLDEAPSGDRPRRGSLGFGEVDLGLDVPGRTGESLEGVPEGGELNLDYETGHGKKPRSAGRHDATDAGLTLDVGSLARVAESRRGLPAWAWVVVAVLLFAGGGVALGQTRFGLFGVYFIERFLPESGDPAVVAQDIAMAEEQASVDTYVGCRTALRTLSDARMQAGLSHPLLARSLLHESLFRLRFGPDAHSEQRSATILSRLTERTQNTEGMRLAQAADAAAHGKLEDAERFLAQAEDKSDPYDGLVRGELALRLGQADKSVAAFERSMENDGGARASYGLLRARLRKDDKAGALAAAQKTLELSPFHVDAYIQLGTWSLAAGAFDEAEAHLERALARRPIEGEARTRPSRNQRARGWTLLGKVQERRVHIGAALVAYDRALSEDAQIMDALLGSGRALLYLGRPRDALARFDAALDAGPSNEPDADGEVPAIEASVGAARALLLLGEPAKAVERLSKADASLAANATLNLWLGHAYAEADDPKMAEGYFRKTIEAAPRDFAGYLALSQMLFAESRPEEATRILDAAKSQVDDDADVRHMLGQSELARNHVDAALEQFQAALKFEPRHPGALFGIAVTQRRKGELASAMSSLDALAALDAAFPGLALERGRILEAQGLYDDAVKVYEDALARQDNDLDLQLQLGAALVSAGNVDRAENLLRRVLKKRPSSAEAEHYIGRVVFARHDSAQAVVHFQRATNLDTTKAVYHMYLGWAALESGNFAGALESIETAVQRDPSLGDAHWIRGRIELRMGAVKDALDSFREALTLSPGRTEAYADMGDAYDQLRKLRSAEKAYETAVEIDPTRGRWWYRLGELRLDRGKRDEAMTALSEAVVLGDREASKPDWLANAHRIYADSLRLEQKTDLAMEHYAVYLQLAPKNAMDRADVERLIETAGR